MARKGENPSITDTIYNHGVQLLVSETGDKRLPVVRIPLPTEAERTNESRSIYLQTQRFGGVEEFNGGAAGLTSTPSPHTTTTVGRTALVEAVKRERGIENCYLPFKGDIAPAHLIAWVWGEDLERVDITKLAQMTGKEREKFFRAAERQVASGVNILKRALSITDKEELMRIRHYGVFGHATSEERKTTGGARGAQSVADWHTNIAYLPRGEMTSLAHIEEVSVADLMKQMGILDTVTFSLFHPAERKRIEELTIQRLPNRKVTITMDMAHGRATDGSEIAFHEGATLRFPDGISYTDAMQVLTDYVGDKEELNIGLRERFELYHKNKSNRNFVAALKSETLQFVESKGYSGRFGEQLVDLTFGSKPTRIQLDKWIEDLKHEGRSREDASLQSLERRKNRYEKILQRLRQPDGKPNLDGLRQLNRVLEIHFKMNPLEAEMFTRMIYDTVKTGEYIDSVDDNIEFTWPVHYSGSFIYDNYEVYEDGSIIVRSMSIASKLGSTKGALEDLMRVAVKRKMAK